MTHEITSELGKNFHAYGKMRRTLERSHRGRFALLHDGELVEVLNDRWDAFVIGRERFGDGGFSIKKIGEPPASLGAATLYTAPIPVE